MATFDKPCDLDTKLKAVVGALSEFYIYVNDKDIEPEYLSHGVTRWPGSNRPLIDNIYKARHEALEKAMQSLIYCTNSLVHDKGRLALAEQTSIVLLGTIITFNNGKTKIDEGVHFYIGPAMFYVRVPKPQHNL